MGLKVAISHERRLVQATAQGQVGLDDLRGFIPHVQAAGLQSYAKLMDFSHGGAELGAADIRALAQAHLAGETSSPRSGPTAIVVDPQADRDLATLYADRSAASSRPLAIFSDRDEALAWLTARAAGGGDGR